MTNWVDAIYEATGMVVNESQAKAIGRLVEARVAERLRYAVDWQPIATMPQETKALVSDGALIRPGVRQGDTILAPFPMVIGLWTHWASFPKPPRIEEGRRGG